MVLPFIEDATYIAGDQLKRDTASRLDIGLRGSQIFLERDYTQWTGAAQLNWYDAGGATSAWHVVGGSYFIEAGSGASDLILDLPFLREEGAVLKSWKLYLFQDSTTKIEYDQFTHNLITNDRSTIVFSDAQSPAVGTTNFQITESPALSLDQDLAYGIIVRPGQENDRIYGLQMVYSSRYGAGLL